MNKHEPTIEELKKIIAEKELEIELLNKEITAYFENHDYLQKINLILRERIEALEKR
jgi:hypothetical protein